MLYSPTYETMEGNMFETMVVFNYRSPNRFGILQRTWLYHSHAVCYLAKRLDKWEINIGQTRLREIWVSDEFDGDIFCSGLKFRCVNSSKPSDACMWTIIKSPRYTGGDFMFLYRFVRRRRRLRRHRRSQILVHAKTFEQLFGFLSFVARLLALTCRLPD